MPAWNAPHRLLPLLAFALQLCTDTDYKSQPVIYNALVPFPAVTLTESHTKRQWHIRVEGGWESFLNDFTLTHSWKPLIHTTLSLSDKDLETMMLSEQLEVNICESFGLEPRSSDFQACSLSSLPVFGFAPSDESICLDAQLSYFLLGNKSY